MIWRQPRRGIRNKPKWKYSIAFVFATITGICGISAELLSRYISAYKDAYKNIRKMERRDGDGAHEARVNAGLLSNDRHTAHKTPKRRPSRTRTRTRRRRRIRTRTRTATQRICKHFAASLRSFFGFRLILARSDGTISLVTGDARRSVGREWEASELPGTAGQGKGKYMIDRKCS